MYSAPQYRFSFLGSIMKSKNEKRPLLGKYNLNTFTWVSPQGPRSSNKTSGEEGRQILGAKKVGYKYLDGYMLFFYQWWLDLLIRLLLQWQLCEISLRRKNNLAAKKSRDARRVSLLCKTELSLDKTEGPLQISHKKDANWCQKLVFMTMRLRWEKINCGCAFYALKTPTVF